MRRFVAALSAWLLRSPAAPAADFEAGGDAHDRGDDAAAYRELLPLAEQGDAAAQCKLGSMYRIGWGVPQDYAEALAWWRKAAEQGDARAQCNLGGMYRFGWGVPQSETEAAAWYLKAAEQGEANAQFDLGGMYREGRGVPKDHVRAYAWLDLAAAGADDYFAERAAETRDSLQKSMTAAQVAAAQRLSSNLSRRLGEGAED